MTMADYLRSQRTQSEDQVHKEAQRTESQFKAAATRVQPKRYIDDSTHGLNGSNL